MKAFRAYLSFAIPGIGMFCEAYIIFSVGNIVPFQKEIWPTCFKTYEDCPEHLITQKITSYIQICGIMVGMAIMGYLGDIIGRKWGSRIASATMLSGVILLTFTPYAPTANSYFVYFMVAQTWYGVGVGAEYPMASSSAAEKAEVSDTLRKNRGREVVLVFSNQGLGNFTNCFVIVLAMMIFGQQESHLDVTGSKNVLLLQYGVGAFVCLVMVFYRFNHLEESELFQKQKEIKSEVTLKISEVQETKKETQSEILQTETEYSWNVKKNFALFYFPRQFIASSAWIANDFAFYGNKLQQSQFMTLLHPAASAFLIMEYTVLNSFIALLGYYAAAMMVDVPWYGRRTMQNVGFIALFVFYITIYAQWDNMNSTANLPQGMQWFQALYYLSSFFNQFGPNCTTFLVSGEIFPTAIRTTNHGIAATLGKLGAIVATIWIINITDRQVFLISALWAVVGVFVTWMWLPDTTGLDLKALDEFHHFLVQDKVHEYHGEAVNPKHLSPWEIYWGWGKYYQVPFGGKVSKETNFNPIVGIASN